MKNNKATLIPFFIMAQVIHQSHLENGKEILSKFLAFYSM